MHSHLTAISLGEVIVHHGAELVKLSCDMAEWGHHPQQQCSRVPPVESQMSNCQDRLVEQSTWQSRVIIQHGRVAEHLQCHINSGICSGQEEWWGMGGGWVGEKEKGWKNYH